MIKIEEGSGDRLIKKNKRYRSCQSRFQHARRRCIKHEPSSISLSWRRRSLDRNRLSASTRLSSSSSSSSDQKIVDGSSEKATAGCLLWTQLSLLDETSDHLQNLLPFLVRISIERKSALVSRQVMLEEINLRKSKYLDCPHCPRELTTISDWLWPANRETEKSNLSFFLSRAWNTSGNQVVRARPDRAGDFSTDFDLSLTGW